MKYSRMPALAACIGIALVGTTPARASFVLTVDDLSNPGIEVIVSDGQGVGFVTSVGATTTPDGGLLPDVISFNGGVGSFTVNVTTGVSEGQIGTGRLDLNSVDISGAAGTLRIKLTDTGYSSAFPAYTADFGGTTDGTVNLDFLHDPTNVEFGGSSFFNPAAAGPGAFSGTGGGPVAAGTPYSLTIVADITHPGGFNITSFDALVTPVPIPPAVYLLGSGLIGLAGIARRRRAG